MTAVTIQRPLDDLTIVVQEKPLALKLATTPAVAHMCAEQWVVTMPTGVTLRQLKIAVREWAEGTLIQDAFPFLDADTRERLMFSPSIVELMGLMEIVQEDDDE